MPGEFKNNPFDKLNVSQTPEGSEKIQVSKETPPALPLESNPSELPAKEPAAVSPEQPASVSSRKAAEAPPDPIEDLVDDLDRQYGKEDEKRERVAKQATSRRQVTVRPRPEKSQQPDKEKESPSMRETVTPVQAVEGQSKEIKPAGKVEQRVEKEKEADPLEELTKHLRARKLIKYPTGAMKTGGYLAGEVKRKLIAAIAKKGFVDESDTEKIREILPQDEETRTILALTLGGADFQEKYKFKQESEEDRTARDVHEKAADDLLGALQKDLDKARKGEVLEKVEVPKKEVEVTMPVEKIPGTSQKEKTETEAKTKEPETLPTKPSSSLVEKTVGVRLSKIETPTGRMRNYFADVNTAQELLDKVKGLNDVPGKKVPFKDQQIGTVYARLYDKLDKVKSGEFLQKNEEDRSKEIEALVREESVGMRLALRRVLKNEMFAASVVLPEGENKGVNVAVGKSGESTQSQSFSSLEQKPVETNVDISQFDEKKEETKEKPEEAKSQETGQKKTETAAEELAKPYGWRKLVDEYYKLDQKYREEYRERRSVLTQSEWLEVRDMMNRQGNILTKLRERAPTIGDVRELNELRDFLDLTDSSNQSKSRQDPERPGEAKDSSASAEPPPAAGGGPETPSRTPEGGGDGGEPPPPETPPGPEGEPEPEPEPEIPLEKLSHVSREIVARAGAAEAELPFVKNQKDAALFLRRHFVPLERLIERAENPSFLDKTLKRKPFAESPHAERAFILNRITSMRAMLEGLYRRFGIQATDSDLTRQFVISADTVDRFLGTPDQIGAGANFGPTPEEKKIIEAEELGIQDASAVPRTKDTSPTVVDVLPIPPVLPPEKKKGWKRWLGRGLAFLGAGALALWFTGKKPEKPVDSNTVPPPPPTTNETAVPFVVANPVVKVEFAKPPVAETVKEAPKVITPEVKPEVKETPKPEILKPEAPKPPEPEVKKEEKKVEKRQLNFEEKQKQLTESSRWAVDLEREMEKEMSRVKTARDAQAFVNKFYGAFNREHYNGTQGVFDTEYTKSISKNKIEKRQVRYMTSADKEMVASISEKIRNTLGDLGQKFSLDLRREVENLNEIGGSLHTSAQSTMESLYAAEKEMGDKWILQNQLRAEYELQMKGITNQPKVSIEQAPGFTPESRIPDPPRIQDNPAPKQGVNTRGPAVRIVRPPIIDSRTGLPYGTTYYEPAGGISIRAGGVAGIQSGPAYRGPRIEQARPGGVEKRVYSTRKAGTQRRSGQR